jgi:hypothetical protein
MNDSRSTDQPDGEYLLELWYKNICPYCGQNIPEGKRVGSGRKSEGGFCSLDCYARYYCSALLERAQKVAEIARRHRDS